MNVCINMSIYMYMYAYNTAYVYIYIHVHIHMLLLPKAERSTYCRPFSQIEILCHLQAFGDIMLLYLCGGIHSF